jgi:hypothetical protein
VGGLLPNITCGLLPVCGAVQEEAMVMDLNPKYQASKIK